MATLNITNFFNLLSQGAEKTGKQGTITDAFQTPFAITVTGTCHQITGSLATAAVATPWDEDDDLPADFDYIHFWSDQACYLQIITTATNFIIPILAKVPFVLSGNTALAAANTTPMSAGVTPSTTAIDSIVISNVSGTTMNYTLSIID